jgi:hypothetical protein
MNGVVIESHVSLAEASAADAVIVGSGRQTREVVADKALMARLQSGSTICVGLIFDMIVVRLFLVPAARATVGPVVLVAPADPTPAQRSASDRGCEQFAMKRTFVGIAVIAAGLALAPAAHAEPGTDIANELQAYGIYGPKDYNAWIGKVTCKRLQVVS